MRRMQLGTWMGSDVFSQRSSPHCPSRTSTLPGILGHQGSLLTPREALCSLEMLPGPPATHTLTQAWALVLLSVHASTPVASCPC